MSAFLIFMKTLSAVVLVKGVKEAWKEDNARMTTADHERQGQAAHRWYKSRTIVEFASGKAMRSRHS